MLILALIILILLSAFSSSSETALFSLSPFTLKAYATSEDNRKRLISALLKKPEKLLVTLLMLNVLVNILNQNTVSSLFGNFTSWILKVLLPLALVLFLGEVIPKSIALINNDKVAYFFSPSIAFLEKLLAPLRNVFTYITSRISHLLFFYLKKEKPISKEELKIVLDECRKKEFLSSDEIKLAKRYLDLYEYTVKEKMIPRSEMASYDINEPLSQLVYLFSKPKVKEILVYDKDLENILGTISFSSFLQNQEKIKDSAGLKKFLERPLFVPELSKCFELFP